MQALPIHRVVEGLDVQVVDLVLVDDETGWRKVHEVIRSPIHAVLKYEGGSDILGADDMVSVLRQQATASLEVC